MEISFVLDWASFWIGAVFAVLAGFLTLLGVAGARYSKQQKRSVGRR